MAECIGFGLYWSINNTVQLKGETSAEWLVPWYDRAGHMVSAENENIDSVITIGCKLWPRCVKIYKCSNFLCQNNDLLRIWWAGQLEVAIWHYHFTYDNAANHCHIKW